MKTLKNTLKKIGLVMDKSVFAFISTFISLNVNFKFYQRKMYEKKVFIVCFSLLFTV